jgi:putative tricarboxylic transport membrane protein
VANRTDRRAFLKAAGLGGAVFLLNACAPAAPSPTAAPPKPAEAKPTAAAKPAEAKPAASPVAGAAAAASPAAAAAAKPAASPAAAAKPAGPATPPPGPIEVVVAAGAGGSTDVLARRIAEILAREKVVEQTLLVQPRPGGSGAVGYQYVLEKKGDPNVLSFFGQSFVTTPITRGGKPYYEDMGTIWHLMLADLIVCCSAKNPNYKTFAEMIEYSKKNPGQVKLGGAQVGSTDHIVASLIDQAAGTKITYVGFQAGAEAIPQVLGGTLDLVVLNPDEAADMSEAGELTQLAILTEQRVKHKTAGQVPTAREQGVNVTYDQVWGLALPPGSAPGLIAWYDQVTAKLVETQAYKDFLDENAFRGHYLSSAQAPAYMKQKHDEHVKIMTDLGLAKS